MSTGESSSNVTGLFVADGIRFEPSVFPEMGQDPGGRSKEAHHDDREVGKLRHGGQLAPRRPSHPGLVVELLHRLKH